MMGTSTFTMRLDENVKREFEAVVNDLGMNMSTAITLFAKATIRRQAIPFDLVLMPMSAAQTEAYRAKLAQELRGAVDSIDDPNTSWHSTQEARKMIEI